eukprot:TRINITY_DN1812_c0_g1_i3.p1 TRINITY_DN1812_c0_g1~~TRINITY_DN1812_c0_g1_i3.p1  ORF type:complete len:429 (-),score=75.08 TRINITY_DN1812_c0_g1_i3:62-1348(-)
MEQFGFLVEHLANIGKLRVLAFVRDGNTDVCSLTANGAKLRLRLCAGEGRCELWRGGAMLMKLPLAVPATVAQPVSVATPECFSDPTQCCALEITRAAEPGDTAVASEDHAEFDSETAPTPLLCAKEPATECLLHCKFCGELLVSRPFKKVSSMPSLYWQELADFWFCDHQPDLHAESSEHNLCTHKHTPSSGKNLLEQFSGRGSICAVEDVCFAGKLTLLVHTSNVDSHKVVEDQAIYPSKVRGANEFAHPLRCATCFHLLGLHFRTPENSELHLLSHCLSTSPCVVHPSRNLLRQFSVETHAAFLLKATSSAHGCYRYRIVDDTLAHAYLQITVLNADVAVQSNMLVPPCDSTTLVPAVKVLYLVCTDKLTVVGYEETLCLPSEECVEVVHTLQRSTKALPDEERIFKQNQTTLIVGYLRLLLEKD